jgi:hypothetical protein
LGLAKRFLDRLGRAGVWLTADGDIPGRHPGQSILALKFTARVAEEVRPSWINPVVEPTASFARRERVRG